MKITCNKKNLQTLIVIILKYSKLCKLNLTLGGLENPRSSVIGLFRRESFGSEHLSSTESTPQKERRGSLGRNAVLLIEDGESDPLGVLQKTGTIPPLPQPPQTPGQRRQARRGSMLELSGCVNNDEVSHM